MADPEANKTVDAMDVDGVPAMPEAKKVKTPKATPTEGKMKRRRLKKRPSSRHQIVEEELLGDICADSVLTCVRGYL